MLGTVGQQEEQEDLALRSFGKAWVGICQSDS